MAAGCGARMVVPAGGGGQRAKRAGGGGGWYEKFASEADSRAREP